MSNKRQVEERYRSRSSSSSSTHSSQSQEEEEDGIRLHVAGLGLGVSRRELKHLFEKYGDLREIWMARSPPCFAFVVYRDRDDAEDALKATDGISLHGNQLRVTYARPRTRGRGRRGFDPNLRCYQCGDKGHFSRDCPDTKYGYKRPPSRRDGQGMRRPWNGADAASGKSYFEEFTDMSPPSRRYGYRSYRSGRSSRSYRHH